MVTAEMKEKVRGKKLLGKGSFTKCYEKDKDSVYLITTDLAKECSFLFGQGYKYFPKIHKRIDIDHPHTMYETKRYEINRAVKKYLNSESWDTYQKLRDKFNKTLIPSNAYDCYRTIFDIFSNTNIHKPIKEELLDFLGDLSNYSTAYWFEISPRNISHDKDGNIIFLDCFFDREKLMKQQSKSIGF